ncbi:hypothetical protein IAU59_001958 [Kwoniella sp. CBS 9459]
MAPITPRRRSSMPPPALPSPSTPSRSSSLMRRSQALVLRTPPSAMQVDVKPDIKPSLPTTPTSSSSSRALIRRGSLTPSSRRRSSATPSATPSSSARLRAALAALASRDRASSPLRGSSTSPRRPLRQPGPIPIGADVDGDVFLSSAGPASGQSANEAICIDHEDTEEGMVSLALTLLQDIADHLNCAGYQLVPPARRPRSASCFDHTRERSFSHFSEASFGTASDFRREETLYDDDPRYGRHVPSTSSGSRQARDDTSAQVPNASIPRSFLDKVTRLGKLIHSLAAKQVLLSAGETVEELREVVDGPGKIRLVVDSFFEEDMTEGRQLLVRSLLDDPAIEQTDVSACFVSKFLSLVQDAMRSSLDALLRDFRFAGKGTKSARQSAWFSTFLASLLLPGAHLKESIGQEHMQDLMYAIRKTMGDDGRAKTVISQLATQLDNVDIAVYRRLDDAFMEMCIEIVGLIWT